MNPIDLCGILIAGLTQPNTDSLEDKSLPGRAVLTLRRPFIKSPKKACQTILFCALDERQGTRTGGYYSQCRQTDPSPRALVEEDQRKLWRISEELVNLEEWETK